MYSQKTVGDEMNSSQYKHAIRNCESKTKTEAVLTSVPRDYCNYER